LIIEMPPIVHVSTSPYSLYCECKLHTLEVKGSISIPLEFPLACNVHWQTEFHRSDEVPVLNIDMKVFFKYLLTALGLCNVMRGKLGCWLLCNKLCRWERHLLQQPSQHPRAEGLSCIPHELVLETSVRAMGDVEKTTDRRPNKHA
jgi:hypothetical protein